MGANIPATSKSRVVIIGGGFAGLNLAKSLVRGGDFQTVMIDKLNYHQFQPLLYQVATSGLEPSAISFPLRKDFQGATDFHFRLATVRAVNPDLKSIDTSIGAIPYDYLVVATGTETNYFGMEKIRSAALPMKSVPEALALRNHILENFERATTANDPRQQESLLTIVVVGGGATGVEIAGAIAEMKRYILKRDYPELDISKVRIILVEGSDKLLRNMSGESSAKSGQFLKHMGVDVRLDSSVADYDNGAVILKNGDSIPTQTLIWVSGVTGSRLEGIRPECYGRGSRLITDPYNAVCGVSEIFAIGDIALQVTDHYPGGHPQVAQVAIQQGELLARNLRRLDRHQSLVPFRYNDMGSMATVGRNKAVVDLNNIKFQGYFAWLVWMIIHLRSILGTKNKILTLINWSWSYITYDQSLRLIIRPDEQHRAAHGDTAADAVHDSDTTPSKKLI